MPTLMTSFALPSSPLLQDPLTGRPEHGGRDRHFCVGVASIEPLVEKLEAAGVSYTKSMSGRAALFFRDPGT